MRYIGGLLIFLSIAFLAITPQTAWAQEKNQFITLVNPIRISIYSSNPAQSLANQYERIKSRKLPASWLLTYDALSNPQIIEVIRSMDENQDAGILMEVTENFAQAAGVKYNKTDSWHRSTSVFLTGYTQSERVKLIDLVFKKFKDQLGFHPTSVGSWWTDSYSLDYMKNRYGIFANLVVADQLDTDGYTVWGQYWAAPYYPSRNHAATPAQNKENKLEVVNIQWAPRDPINGYLSPTNFRASLYSTQDYYTLGLPDEYLEKLINLYAGQHDNQFGQITFGLEGDFEPQNYTVGGQYDKYLQIAKNFSNSGKFMVTNMKQFSQWYMRNFTLSPDYLTVSDDLLGKNLKVIWYQTPYYRISFVIDQITKTLKVTSFYVFFANFREPFYLSPNKQLDLYIKLPQVVDSTFFNSNQLLFKDVTFYGVTKQSDGVKLTFNNQGIELKTDQIIFSSFKQSLPTFLSKSSYLKPLSLFRNTGFTIRHDFPYDASGRIFTDLTPTSSHFLKQRKIAALGILSLAIIGLAYFVIARFCRIKVRIISYTILTTTIILFGLIYYQKNSTQYSISQAELDALFNLSLMPPGKVLVLNRECLQCYFHTAYQPAVFANLRRYVKELSHHDLIFDDKLIESHSIELQSLTKIKREDAKNYIRGLNVDYIYLVKHEDYTENIPYSPGDLDVQQVFINSDAQIWKVRKS